MKRNSPAEVIAGLSLITTIEFRNAFASHLDKHFPNHRAIHSNLSYSLSIDTAIANLYLTGSVHSSELFTWLDAFDCNLRLKK